MEQVYIVEIEIYKGDDFNFPNLTWLEAVKMAKGFSATIPTLLNWTRHSNNDSPIQHMDNYFDLFNEGAIKIIK